MERSIKQKIYIAIITIIALMAVICTMVITLKQQNYSITSPEALKANSYAKLTEEDAKVEGTNYVKFSSFFLRSSEANNKAEKLLGTCKKTTEKDMLYIDLNVLSDGYLEDAVIEVQGDNLSYELNVVEDEIITNVTTSDNTTTIGLNKIQAGTQKLIQGEISAKLNDNINKYSSNANKVILTGTHVANDGTRTQITKTVNLTVDWYGELESSIYMYEKEVEHNFKDEGTVSFSFAMDENKNELLLKDNKVKVILPTLNGYNPEEINCIVTGDVAYNTNILEITKQAEVDANGNITTKLPNSNTYTVTVKYPQEAIERIGEQAPELEVQIEGYFTAYNNPGEEFNNEIDTNIAKSNIVQDTLKIIPEKVHEEKTGSYNFSVAILDKTYNKKNNTFVISKDKLLEYFNNDDSENTFKYTVEWDAIISGTSSVQAIVMNEADTKESYGDKFNENIIDKYTATSALYVENAEEVLGENGTITVYNNDTNEVLVELTKDSWNNYNAENSYTFENGAVKHIKIETSAPQDLDGTKVLKVYNIKEIDKAEFKNEYSLEDAQNIEVLYTYLQGTVEVPNTEVAEGEQSATKNVKVNTFDMAYLQSKISYAQISVDQDKILTGKVLENEKIFIKTIVEDERFDSNWKNGEFTVELPKEIIAMEVNSITIDNANVEIENYELNQVDDKYVLTIKTANEIEGTYTITVDAKLTPDYRIDGGTKDIKLYCYNELADRYYKTEQDIYDTNKNENTEDKVGLASTQIELMASQELITYETISNYTKQKDSDEWSSETTFAPNIAEVDNEERQATINVVLNNRYHSAITNVKVLGRIPFENNAYILNGQDLGSEFTSKIAAEGIKIPQELDGKVAVYYSEKTDARKDLDNAENGWKALSEFDNTASIKSYLIDFKDNAIEENAEYVFGYDVEIPDSVENFLVTYSNHTAYYGAETADGILNLSTEPTKVGIKIVRNYNLIIKTYEEKDNTLLNESIYKLTWSELDEAGKAHEKSMDVQSDANGNIVINNLFEGIKYTLNQIKVQDGYMINNGSLKFKAVNDEYGNLQAVIVSDDGLVRINIDTNEKDIIANDRNVTVGVENKQAKELSIYKIDEDDSTPIQNVLFDIYKVDNNLNESEKVYGSVKTDENGKIKVWLASGLYKAVETETANDYQLPTDIEDRTRYFEVEINNEEETDIYPINTIEDLVELSRLVNSGDESVKNKTIKLMRNLDFKDDSSYKKYDDENTLKELKLNLLSGAGFTPIGNGINPFSGTFDGNGYEIRNIYIHTNGDVGLFGYVVGAQIKNVRLAGGTIIDSSTSNGYVGGIVGRISDNGNQENVNIITNCYNSATINGGQFVAGIVGQALGKVTIANCCNAGNLTGNAANVAGIIGMAIPTNDGSIVNCSLLNCYNTGKLVRYGNGSSGIAANINCGQITNCYNLGELAGNGSCGICDYSYLTTIKNCYYLATTAEKGSNTTQDEEGIIESKSLEEINNTSFSNLLNQNIENIESEISLQTWYGSDDRSPKFVDVTDSIVMTNIKKVHSKENDDAISSEYYMHNIKNSSTIIKNNEIYKIDEKTGAPISDVGFEIYKTDENYNNPIRSKTVYTTNNGRAQLNLQDGYYKAVETYVPSGYIFEDNEEDRTTYFQVKTNTYINTDSTGIYVNYIEDLIEIAENVNTNKTTYVDRTIYLLRDLDMDNRASYRNPDAQSKYDYNKNRTTETLWDELHTEGCNYGLIPIGSGPFFNGNFDGCGHALINFKIGQGESNTGLFGGIQDGSVVNIEIKGNTIVNGSTNVGTIAGLVIDGTVENCCNHYSTGGSMIATGSCIGGIVGNASGKTVIKNCVNAKNITINTSSAPTGGIVGVNSGSIINCYNLGNIIVESGSNIGGICGYGSGNIVNCYNEGEIIGKYYVTGICGYIGNNSKILNSYNKGHIKALTSPAAGIYCANSGVSGLEINNNYNMGLVEFNINGQMTNYIGQITTSGTDADVQNCYYELDKIIDYQQAGTGLSKYYMLSNDFVKLLNDNQQTIDTDYALSKWILADDGPTLENVGIISTGVDITKDYTYNISTASELRELARKINSGEITGNVKVVLKNDINLGNQEFTPIGTSSNPFNGTFEGNGHVIEGLYISNYQYGSPNYAGLFGVVESGSINKLGVKGKIVISQSSSSTYVGGLIGVTKIKNGRQFIVNSCYSEVEIDTKTLAGGLIGLCAGGNVSIYNSYNAGNIKGSDNIAGIVGTSAGNTEIVNCYNSGNLSGIYLNIYGIVGGNSSNSTNTIIKNCINVGTLIADQGYGSYYAIADANRIAYNSYYLGSERYTTSQKGISKTAEEMQSKEFWQLMNEYVQQNDSDIELKTWKYNAGAYPTLGLAEDGFKDDKYLQISNRQAKTVKIIKEDEETEAKLPGVEFKIETAKEVKNYSTYPYIGEKQYKQANDCYDFMQIGNVYTSGNQIVTPSNYGLDATAYFEIDLTGLYGTWTLQYNASVSGTTSNHGYTFLSTSGGTAYSSSNQQLHINGNSSGTYSVSLTPNKKNYFILGHERGGLGNTFTVGNMKLLYNGNVINNIAYSSKISGADQVPYVTINLNENTGKKYLLEVEASINSKENTNFGYAAITNSGYPWLSDQEQQNGLVYISGNIDNKKYTQELEGGSTYYLHIGNKINDSSTTAKEEFKITSIKLKEIKEQTLTTNADGKINFSVPQGDWVRITETKAPNGYASPNYTQTVTMDEDVQLTVKNKKDTLFTINKVDEETEEPLAGVKFAIYKVTAGQSIIEQAKYSNGSYVGTLENGLYVVTTDKNGKINLNLPEGYYKAVEVEPAEGFILEEDENLRTIYFEVKDPEIQSQTIVDTNYQEGTVVNISTIEDLKTVAQKVNSGEDDYEGKTLKLMNDLDFNNTDGNLITIAKNNTFRGNFDGNNHTIRNISSTTENSLFGKIENSYIKDLTVENANFKTTDATNGGLIAEAYNSTIDSVKSTGENNIEGIGTENYGTVVGYAKNSTINKCSNERNIVINNTSNYQLKNVAGIVGKGSNVRIIECNNSGAISSGNGGTSNVNFVGIVGNIIDSGLVEKCTNTGNIIGNTGEYSSGIIGGTSENVTIKDCSNQAEIKSNSGSNGIAYIIQGGTIINCYNVGTITSGNPSSGILYRLDDGTIKNCHNSGYINCFGSYASGIVYQLNDSEVRDCYNEGKNEASQFSSGIAYEANNSKIIDCYNKGELTKAAQLAGIVGNSKNNSVILNCYNDAVINATNSAAAGIVYIATDSTVSNCHNNKDISANYPTSGVAYTITRTKINNCYNTADITSNVPVGGIVYTANDNSLITNCYNTGTIKSSNNGAGGIVYGLANSKIYNCYNKGNVITKGDTTYTSAGGILFSTNGICEIANCYNSGVITAETDNADTYSLAYKSSVDCFKNCYYIEGTANHAVGEASESLVGNYEKISSIKAKSKEFSNELNNNRLSIESDIELCNWQYNGDNEDYKYPTLIPNTFKTGNEATITNKKIPTLTIVKTDQDTGTPLSGAKFDIVNTEDNTTLGTNLATNAQGKITVNLPSSGTIKITETKAPNGYIKLENSITVKAGKENINVDIKNKKAKTYTINKKDEDTNEPIKGAKFVIYKIESPSQEDFAKDGNGNYIGTKEGNLYVFTTNSNGQITLDLPNGVYRAVEVEAARGYELGEDNEFIFEIDNGSGSYKITPEESEDCYEVNYIEDLLDLYKLVKDGDTFEGKTVKLMRDLDYEDDSSYKNPNTGFNEYVGTDSTSIKEMLVNHSGNFAVSIGNNVTPFKGIFDGNNKIISHYRYGILFDKTDGAIIKDVTFKDVIVTAGGAVVKNATDTVIRNIKLENCSGNVMHGLVYESNNSNISNIKVTGESDCTVTALVVYTANNSIITSCENDSQVKDATGYTGMIVSILNNSLLINCGNNGDILKINGGAVVGNSENSQMIKCYNTGNISSSSSNQIGGLAETVKNTIMCECYNTGDIHGTGAAGGLAFSITDSTIRNCYNSGNITGTAVSGGLAWKIDGSVINNCHNSGNINVDAPAGGLAYTSGDSTYVNSYNSGNLEVTSAVGGIVQSSSNCKIYNCYNSGNVKCTRSTPTAGIAQSATGSIDNCYNSGIVDTAAYVQNHDGTTKKHYAGIVLDVNDRLKLNNCYYSESSAPEGVFYMEDVPGQYEKVTLDQLQSQEFVNKLNSNKASIESEYKLNDWILDGTPKLKASSIPVVTQDSATMTNKKVGKIEYTVTVNHVIAYGDIVGGGNYEIEDWYKTDVYHYEEGSQYKVTPSEELLKEYDLVKTVGTPDGIINKDEVITYYYKKKEHVITTRVEIPDGRTDKGGSITGEGETPYETVICKENSTKEIVTTPDDGYRVKEIRLVSTSENGEKVETIIYGENADSTSEIKAREKSDGSVELTQFVNMTADKEIIVVFEPNEGTVIVHHYVEDSEDQIHDDQVTKDVIGKEVDTDSVDEENYVLIEEPNEKNTTVQNRPQELTYYYQIVHKITTDVVEHDEVYKETIEEATITQNVEHNVKGGDITDEDEQPHETVIRYRNSKDAIEFEPATGYEIVKVTINDADFDFKQAAETNDKVTLDKNGKLTLQPEFFENVTEDKHIEVEYKKKSTVVVKYLSATEVDEEGKPIVLAEEELIEGYETKDFTTERKPVAYYQSSSKGITDENDNNITKYSRVTLDENNNAEGQMYADTLTIIYWYERIPSGIVVKHIEINEKDIEDGLTLESGTLLDEETLDGYVSLTEDVERHIYSKNPQGVEENVDYKDYISVNGPQSTNENLVIVGKDTNNKTVTYKDDVVVEVRYYYEKQHKVTTEVKPHTETDAEGNETEVDGGTISGQDEDLHETINHRGHNKEIIEIKSDDGYQIKSITINDEEKSLDSFTIKEDGSIVIPKNYFDDVQEDIHIVVEFERIPAVVIVQYLDVDTNEVIYKTADNQEYEVINGLVNDEYKTEPKDIENYELVEDKYPENSEGRMTKEEILVTYYYKKTTVPVNPDKEEPKQDTPKDEIPDEPIAEPTTEPEKTSTETSDNGYKHLPQQEQQKETTSKKRVKTGDKVQYYVFTIALATLTVFIVINKKKSHKAIGKH